LLSLREQLEDFAMDLLTHRQREVLQLLAEGKQVKEIAAVLNLSPKTVEFHKYRIMALLGLHTVADLARYAMKQRMVE
jgi:DNA-binding NarL/FixJ family response regulator